MKLGIKPPLRLEYESVEKNHLQRWWNRLDSVWVAIIISLTFVAFLVGCVIVLFRDSLKNM